MNILVLNGSPRPQGNTVKMIAAFQESAEKAGHKVNIVNVCRKDIKVSSGRNQKNGSQPMKSAAKGKQIF